MSHQVEAEPVDLIVPRPSRERIDHQLFHHGVFRSGVLAARRGLDRAVRVQAVIVAGDDPIEHGLVVLAARGGVVVHDVHDDPQAEAVDAGDHLAKFTNATGPFRVGRVRPFRDGEVKRVVAPVEGVGVPHGGDGLLRRGGVGREAL